MALNWSEIMYINQLYNAEIALQIKNLRVQLEYVTALYAKTCTQQPFVEKVEQHLKEHILELTDQIQRLKERVK